jgi:cytochrome P450
MSSTTSISLATLDLFAHGAPWDLFAELRENDPVNWNEEEAPQSGFWSVMRYHDIVKVLRDPDTFTSERFTNLEEVDAEQEEARRSLLETDGQRHRALRRLLQGQFTPPAVAKYETFLLSPKASLTSSKRSPPTSPSKSWQSFSVSPSPTRGNSLSGATGWLGLMTRNTPTC